MAIYYRQADTLSEAMAGTLQRDVAGMCTGGHAFRHTHTLSVVPGCSVYIIAFEMVMHEPVNQLLLIKGLGHILKMHTPIRTW